MIETADPPENINGTVSWERSRQPTLSIADSNAESQEKRKYYRRCNCVLFLLSVGDASHRLRHLPNVGGGMNASLRAWAASWDKTGRHSNVGADRAGKRHLCLETHVRHAVFVEMGKGIACFLQTNPGCCIRVLLYCYIQCTCTQRVVSVSMLTSILPKNM